MDIIERERDFLSTTNLDWSKTDNDILANYTVKCCGALCDYVLHNLYRNMNNIAHDNMKKKKVWPIGLKHCHSVDKKCNCII